MKKVMIAIVGGLLLAICGSLIASYLCADDLDEFYD